MGFGLSLIPLHPGAPIRASDVNTNFSAINNATTFTGEVTGSLAGGTSTLQLKAGPVGASVDASGNVSFSHTFQGYAGIFPQCTVFFNIGNATINHGLGAIPDAIFLQAQFTSTPNCRYTYSNLNATTVTITSDNQISHYKGLVWKIT